MSPRKWKRKFSEGSFIILQRKKFYVTICFFCLMSVLANEKFWLSELSNAKKSFHRLRGQKCFYTPERGRHFCLLFRVRRRVKKCFGFAMVFLFLTISLDFFFGEKMSRLTLCLNFLEPIFLGKISRIVSLEQFIGLCFSFRTIYQAYFYVNNFSGYFFIFGEQFLGVVAFFRLWNNF